MKLVKLNLLSVIIIAFITACGGDDEPIIKSTVLTESGVEVSLDGIWTSECIDFTQFRLQEDFDFDGRNLLIDIRQYEDGDCTSSIEDETITIEFQVTGQVQVQLNGQTVMANKVTGTERSSRKNTTDDFKQSFYIDDRSSPMMLYHGVFGDDGGALSSDGFPVELHPFAIARQ